MANVELSYCVRCKEVTSFYHVDPEFWECEKCGHKIEDYEVGNTETDYPEDDDEDWDLEDDDEEIDEEFDTEGSFEYDIDEDFDVDGKFD